MVLTVGSNPLIGKEVPAGLKATSAPDTKDMAEAPPYRHNRSNLSKEALRGQKPGSSSRSTTPLPAAETKGLTSMECADAIRRKAFSKCREYTWIPWCRYRLCSAKVSKATRMVCFPFLPLTVVVPRPDLFLSGRAGVAAALTRKPPWVKEPVAHAGKPPAFPL